MSQEFFLAILALIAAGYAIKKVFENKAHIYEHEAKLDYVEAMITELAHQAEGEEQCCDCSDDEECNCDECTRLRDQGPMHFRSSN